MTVKVRSYAWVSRHLCLTVSAVLLAGCGGPDDETGPTTTITTTTTADCNQYLEKYHEKHISELADVMPETYSTQQSVSWKWCKGEAVERLKEERGEEDNFSSWPLIYVFALMVIGGIMKILIEWCGPNVNKISPSFESVFDHRQDDEQLETKSWITKILKATSLLYWHAMPSMLLLMGFFTNSCAAGIPPWVYGVYAVFACIQLTTFVTMMRDWDTGGINGAPIFGTSALLQIAAFSALEHVDLGTDVLAMGVAGACHREAIHLWRKAWTRSFGSLGKVLIPMFVYMGLKGYCALLFFHFSWFPQAHALSLVSGTTMSLLGFACSCILSVICALLHKYAWVWLHLTLECILWLLYTVGSAVVMWNLLNYHGNNGLHETVVEKMYHEHYAGFMVTDYVPLDVKVMALKAAAVEGADDLENGAGEKESFGAAAARVAARAGAAARETASAAEAMAASGCKVAQEIRANLTRLLLENCVQLVTQSMFFALTQHVLSTFATVMQLLSLAVSFVATVHKLVRLFLKVGKIDKRDRPAFWSSFFMMLIASGVLLFCILKVTSALRCFHAQGLHKKPTTWNLTGEGCVYDDEL